MEIRMPLLDVFNDTFLSHTQVAPSPPPFCRHHPQILFFLLTCISILIFIHARVKWQFGPIESETKRKISTLSIFLIFSVYVHFERFEMVESFFC